MSAEKFKRESRYLRGALAEELATDGEAFTTEGSDVLLKFHGIYQQDDRDVRRERASKKLPLVYSCMVRAAVPGGLLGPEQWLVLDRLADLTNGTLRLTTRQGVQFHFVHKGSLRALVHGINEALLTTLAACGDVVRNIMACPWPDERQAVLRPLVAALVERFRPRTSAYWELWVDGEKAVTAEPATGFVEPVYGPVYLPRKFKIGIAWPGDNCVDVFANDLGIVPTLDGGRTGELTGYNLYAGGGLGQSHARPDDTYPRLASPLGWIRPERIVDVAESVVTVQRDHGNREDRHRARLKYLLDERGISWLRAEVERRLGEPLAGEQPLPPWTAEEHHGTRDGVVGLPVPSGKVADAGGVLLRTALRELVADGTVGEIRVTPRQDLLLGAVARSRVGDVEQRLRDHGVALAQDVSALRRLSIACPALPTCGQALGEAERVLPSLVDELEKVISDAGAGDAPIRLNMTGCPNGCARPYTAEIGIVGRTKTTYDLYAGGSPTGDRLGTLIRADVPLAGIAAVLAPVFRRYAAAGSAAAFGDWANDAGAAAVTSWLPEPVARRRTRAE